MKTEYRIIFTATFDTTTERDKAYDLLKAVVASDVSQAAVFKRADMTKDEYLVPDIGSITEKVI